MPRFFSDVVHCQRKVADFTWSTATLNVDLKARNLEIGDNLPPSFVPLMKGWENNGGVYDDTNGEETP